MKKVRITLTRKVKFFAEIEISDSEFELIKDLDNEDVEMYDRSTIKTLESGHKTISINPQYLVLEDIDSDVNEMEREDTMYDVTVRDLSL